MPTIEERCYCDCSGCKIGHHCGILDNDCMVVRSDQPMTDEEQLREDEIRAATGMFDFDSLSNNSLNPFEETEDDEQGENE